METPQAKPASAIAATSATLNGILNPAHQTNLGSYEFRYRQNHTECEGTDEKTTLASGASGAVGEAVNMEATGLLPDTTYTFCLRESDEAGEEVLSVPVTFRTLPEAYATDVTGYEQAGGVDSNGVGRGHPADGHKQVAEIQRSKMLTAMVQEIAQRGAANVSVAHVVGRSGVSRRTFYEIFEDREDCFLAAFDDALEYVATVVIPAYEAPGSWRVRIRGALTALLECLESDPATGRLLIVESLAAGPKALERRQSVLAQILPVIEQGQSEGKASVASPPLTAEGSIPWYALTPCRTCRCASPSARCEY